MSSPVSHTSLPFVASTLFYFLLQVFSSAPLRAAPCQSIHEKCTTETNEFHIDVIENTQMYKI
jgi:hypothetical protein